MEKVILNTSDLNQLAFHHPTLAIHFQGTFPCDKLPRPRTLDNPRGFIVNTDPSDMPGRHWLGLWMNGNKCEVMDSFALDLEMYETTLPLKKWLNENFKYVIHSGQSLQSVYDQSCGGYALMFLVAKSQGIPIEDFLKTFSLHDYLSNDHKVGMWIRSLIHKERRWQEEAVLLDSVDGETLPIQGTSRSIGGVRHLCCV